MDLNLKAPSGLIYPTFTHTRNRKEWPPLFAQILFAHGPPPPNCLKRRKTHPYPYVVGKEGLEWVRQIVKDIMAASWENPEMMGFKDHYVSRQARHMKNRFLEWCWETLNE